MLYITGNKKVRVNCVATLEKINLCIAQFYQAISYISFHLSYSGYWKCFSNFFNELDQKKNLPI